ncbi:MAG TPA: ureidoglycolate lyase [Paracoccaceae bacterium]|nr:ureidoglycolate lyase [Paracoccaceae bacterium]
MLLPVVPDAAAFAPYGALIEPPQAPGDRRMFSDWIAPVAGLAPQFHINHVAPAALPLRLDMVERHPHSAQAFVPMDVSRYLVTVMPEAADGRPDPAAALCFLMPGTMGVIYRRDAWHAGITVLDRPGAFAVLMWRGAVDDDVTAQVAPRLIDLPPASLTGTSP